ncbi:MAG TPA: spermidine/putrescine ABC transporter substrate-binding protein [Candidatus Limnocylindrales bacterium]|nr:spermidine/putrescine ABC transporter substrate-binding protein [Candidatus Limnocylindrales bacterium]
MSRGKAVIASLAACISMTACTGGGTPTGEINLFAWSEYVPQAVIDGFTRETGIRVNYETYSSNEEMLAKLVSGAQKYDLIQPSEYVVEALAKERALLPVDWSKVPNIANIGAQYRNLPHDPEQKLSVPWMAGSVGIVVNTEKVREPIRGYGDLFQEKHRGRIVIVDDTREIVSWALASLGKGANDVTPQTLAAVRPVLEKWLPLVKVYDGDSPKTALLNGDVDLGIVWSGEAALLYQEDPKFRYVLPSEGAHQFLDSLAIPKDAANPEGAMAFMNYALRPEVGKLISDEFPYTNPNLKARELLSEEQRANPASYPPGDPKLETFRDIGEMAAQIDELVTDIKAGI